MGLVNWLVKQWNDAKERDRLRILHRDNARECRVAILDNDIPRLKEIIENIDAPEKFAQRYAPTLIEYTFKTDNPDAFDTIISLQEKENLCFKMPHTPMKVLAVQPYDRRLDAPLAVAICYGAEQIAQKIADHPTTIPWASSISTLQEGNYDDDAILELIGVDKKYPLPSELAEEYGLNDLAKTLRAKEKITIFRTTDLMIANKFG
jgi:hypothetical protein